MSRNTKFIFKFFLTLTFCAVIALNIDWNAFWLQAQNVDLGGALIAFSFMLGAQAISAYKWKIILSIHKIHFRFSVLHRYYYTAMFFNNFLPTSIGGDGYRIYKTLDNNRSKTSAVIAILMERITGMSALLVIGLGGGLLGYIKGSGDMPGFSILFGAICSLILTAIILAALGPIIQKALLGSKKKIAQRLEYIISHASDYQQHKLKSIQIILISFLFQSLAIVRYFMLVLAVGEICPLWGIATVVSISALVSILPLSINGIGLLDASFIFLIGLFGVDNESSLLVMIIHRILLIPISLVGGILYLFEKNKKYPRS